MKTSRKRWSKMGIERASVVRKKKTNKKRNPISIDRWSMDPFDSDPVYWVPLRAHPVHRGGPVWMWWSNWILLSIFRWFFFSKSDTSSDSVAASKDRCISSTDTKDSIVFFGPHKAIPATTSHKQGTRSLMNPITGASCFCFFLFHLRSRRGWQMADLSRPDRNRCRMVMP